MLVRVAVVCLAALLPLAAAQRCDGLDYCTCEKTQSGRDVVSCKGRNPEDTYVSVVGALFAKDYVLEELTLQTMLETNLPAAVFRSFGGSLTKLTIKDSRLETLSRNAFEGLNNLEELYLEGTQLKSLPSSVIQTLRLRKLSLFENNLSKFNASTLGQSLEWLDVSNNALTEVPADLGNLDSVRTLNLSGNRIKEVTDIKNMQQLRVLDLSRNKLELVDKHSLLGSQELQTVKLNGNNLRFLDPTAVRLPNIGQLELQDNPWFCDCALNDLREILSTRNLCKTDACKPRCENTGALLVNLSEEQLCSTTTAPATRTTATTTSSTTPLVVSTADPYEQMPVSTEFWDFPENVLIAVVLILIGVILLSVLITLAIVVGRRRRRLKYGSLELQSDRRRASPGQSGATSETSEQCDHWKSGPLDQQLYVVPVDPAAQQYSSGVSRDAHIRRTVPIGEATQGISASDSCGSQRPLMGEAGYPDPLHYTEGTPALYADGTPVFSLDEHQQLPPPFFTNGIPATRRCETIV